MEWNEFDTDLPTNEWPHSMVKHQHFAFARHKQQFSIPRTLCSVQVLWVYVAVDELDMQFNLITTCALRSAVGLNGQFYHILAFSTDCNLVFDVTQSTHINFRSLPVNDNTNWRRLTTFCSFNFSLLYTHTICLKMISTAKFSNIDL